MARLEEMLAIIAIESHAIGIGHANIDAHTNLNAKYSILFRLVVQLGGFEFVWMMAN